ncbi:MAG: ABC transporter permease [Christensenellales bacterium]|jgi:multidrug/hemolysin transport system permease protein
MRALIRRNMRVFFRDRASVFFSLLAVLIIIGLYVLFLGDVMASNLPDMPGARALSDNWIMSGLLAVTSATTVMGAFGTMVDDRARKIEKDFLASPVGRAKIAGGYVVSSFIVGVIMTFLTFALAIVYITVRGGDMIAPTAAINVILLILLSAICNTAMVSFLASFIKSQNAFGTVSSILGTLIGFLTGIYMPIGVLPEAVQVFIKFFPVSHAALLLRGVMTQASMQAVFAGAPAGAAQGFKEMMGISYRFGDTILPAYASLLILAGTTALFAWLSVLRFSKKKK